MSNNNDDIDWTAIVFYIMVGVVVVTALLTGSI